METMTASNNRYSYSANEVILVFNFYLHIFKLKIDNCYIQFKVSYLCLKKNFILDNYLKKCFILAVVWVRVSEFKNCG